MLSAFKYRLYPKPEQEMRLNRSLLLLCNLYNDLKAQEMRRYREENKSTSLAAFRRLALDARKQSEELRAVHSQVVQNVGDRIHRSFRNFFEGRARFPMWKQPHRYSSLTYPQSGFKLDSQLGLCLSGIGYVRIFVHRPLLGRVKRLTIKREADGWYATFIAEREAPAKRPIAGIPASRVRGADLGLDKFVVMDDATSTEYPEFLRRSEDKIKRLQHHFSRKHKGSKRRLELGRRLARLHLHVRRQREDFQNKLVHKIFAENDALILEKLNVSGMLRNYSLAKSITDASWGRFARRAIFKAESMGKHTIFVDPWGTTQFCHNCLQWVPKDLAEREHKCPNCGETTPRDLNSALLIKRLGTPRSPAPDRGSSLAEQGSLPSLREWASSSSEAGSSRLQS
ncbi:MAG: transposase [Nitrososphaerales archaeon]|nr:transposase [Nitrososphaerales archaeon]